MKKVKRSLDKRVFVSGAIRNNAIGKFDYEGFVNPAVENSYARYMHNCRKMEDGTYRDSDNWQKGIPSDELMKSLHRHFMDVHLLHRGFRVFDETGHEILLEDCLNGLKFNVNAYILNIIKQKKSNFIKRGE